MKEVANQFTMDIDLSSIKTVESQSNMSCSEQDSDRRSLSADKMYNIKTFMKDCHLFEVLSFNHTNQVLIERATAPIIIS